MDNMKSLSIGNDNYINQTNFDNENLAQNPHPSLIKVVNYPFDPKTDEELEIEEVSLKINNLWKDVKTIMSEASEECEETLTEHNVNITLKKEVFLAKNVEVEEQSIINKSSDGLVEIPQNEDLVTFFKLDKSKLRNVMIYKTKDAKQIIKKTLESSREAQQNKGCKQKEYTKDIIMIDQTIPINKIDNPADIKKFTDDTIFIYDTSIIILLEYLLKWTNCSSLKILK